MYQVRDNVLSNRIVSFADGEKITFSNHMAIVPDKYVQYFSKISDFHVQIHTEEVVTPPEVPVVNEPVQAAKMEYIDERKDFKKVTEKK